MAEHLLKLLRDAYKTFATVCKLVALARALSSVARRVSIAPLQLRCTTPLRLATDALISCCVQLLVRKATPCEKFTKFVSQTNRELTANVYKFLTYLTSEVTEHT